MRFTLAIPPHSRNAAGRMLCGDLNNAYACRVCLFTLLHDQVLKVSALVQNQIFNTSFDCELQSNTVSKSVPSQYYCAAHVHGGMLARYASQSR